MSDNTQLDDPGDIDVGDVDWRATAETMQREIDRLLAELSGKATGVMVTTDEGMPRLYRNGHRFDCTIDGNCSVFDAAGFVIATYNVHRWSCAELTYYVHAGQAA